MTGRTRPRGPPVPAAESWAGGPGCRGRGGAALGSHFPQPGNRGGGRVPGGGGSPGRPSRGDGRKSLMAPRDPPCGPALGEGRGPPGSTGPHGRRPPPSPLGTGMRAQAQPWHRHAHRHACAHPARGHGRPRAACTHGRAGTGTRTVGWALSKHTHAHTHPPLTAAQPCAHLLHACTHTHTPPQLCAHGRAHTRAGTAGSARVQRHGHARSQLHVHMDVHTPLHGVHARAHPPPAASHTRSHTCTPSVRAHACPHTALSLARPHSGPGCPPPPSPVQPHIGAQCGAGGPIPTPQGKLQHLCRGGGRAWGSPQGHAQHLCSLSLCRVFSTRGTKGPTWDGGSQGTQGHPPQARGGATGPPCTHAQGEWGSPQHHAQITADPISPHRRQSTQHPTGPDPAPAALLQPQSQQIPVPTPTAPAGRPAEPRGGGASAPPGGPSRIGPGTRQLQHIWRGRAGGGARRM